MLLSKILLQKIKSEISSLYKGKVFFGTKIRGKKFLKEIKILKTKFQLIKKFYSI